MDLPFSQQMTNTTDRGWQENNSNEMKNYYYRAVMSGFYFPGGSPLHLSDNIEKRNFKQTHPGNKYLLMVYSVNKKQTSITKR
ncbi:uncharacterized protein LOC143256811 isoform X3 [Tachypleus tridentatus]|uniref:uncharacterized protein LOC143256811 isoform X3 n=1 Tax=Tachypleus tridentatus TaxID=6853 RepID=UPI003FCF4EDD